MTNTQAIGQALARAGVPNQIINTGGRFEAVLVGPQDGDHILVNEHGAEIVKAQGEDGYRESTPFTQPRFMGENFSLEQVHFIVWLVEDQLEKIGMGRPCDDCKRLTHNLIQTHEHSADIPICEDCEGNYGD